MGGLPSSRSTCILIRNAKRETSTCTYRFCSTRNFQNVYLKLSTRYSSSDIDLAYTTLGYTSSEIDLAYTTVGYPSNEAELAYTIIG